MKILGIDVSGMVASVAIVEDDIVVGEYSYANLKKTHSQTLLPMLEELKKTIAFYRIPIDAIAVAAGPGSFYRLRIGSATAKGLGLALDKPIISVSTIEAMAYNLWGSADNVCPIMDARADPIPVFITLRIQRWRHRRTLCCWTSQHHRKINATGKSVTFFRRWRAGLSRGNRR